MASMNNWLAFSLSSQQQHPHINSDDISGGDCFDLTAETSASFDWNMKGSEVSTVMGGSSCNQEQPKLENFLGNHYNGGDEDNSTNNSTIGLSMIKTWLSNQSAPPPTQVDEAKSNGGGAQSLSLSMIGGSGGDSSSSDNNKHQKSHLPTSVETNTMQGGANEAMPKKSIETFGQRTSIYRGVTRHRWTGRYEAHLWDNSCRREGQSRKGRQVYLGGYDKEEKAARAYDLAALKYWGTTTTTNLPMSNYEKELEEMKHMTRQEYVASLRRKSSGFSRGASMYRGVTRHHQHGRWQARIGRVAGNKDLYLGTFSTQEEAAEAYDIAAIKFRGLNAVTNFDMARYDVKSILESSQLPIDGASKRLKNVEQEEIGDNSISMQYLSDGINNYDAMVAHHHGWPTIAYQQAQPYGQRVWCKQEQDSDGNQTFRDRNQLQLGSSHNFFQPSSVLHNLMAMQNSSGSNANPVMYSNGGTVSDGVGYVTGNGNQGSEFGDNEVEEVGNGNVYGSTDPYHSRNSYYLPQQ